MFEKILNLGVPSAAEVFKNVVAVPDLLYLVERSIWNDKATYTLLIGPPATAKSLIGQEIERKIKHWYIFDCSNMSGKGLIDFLAEHQELSETKGGVVLDEVDKLPKNQQATLNNWLETGQINYQTAKTKYHFKLKCKVLATSNSVEKLTKPLRSRFFQIYLQPYTYDQFVEISRRLLLDLYKIPADVAEAIAKVCWEELAIKDVRMLKHIGSRIRKEDRADDIENLVKLMVKYGQINAQNTEFN